VLVQVNSISAFSMREFVPRPPQEDREVLECEDVVQNGFRYNPTSNGPCATRTEGLPISIVKGNRNALYKSA
jgi:hypothetical protein